MILIVFILAIYPKIREQFHHFLRYPFKCNTIVNFIGCNLIQVPVVIIGSTVFYSVLLLTFVLYEKVNIFISDVEFSLRKLNKKIIKDAKKNRRKLTPSQCVDAMKKMSSIVKFYSEARELCEDRFESAFDHFSLKIC